MSVQGVEEEAIQSHATFTIVLPCTEEYCHRWSVEPGPQGKQPIREGQSLVKSEQIYVWAGGNCALYQARKFPNLIYKFTTLETMAYLLNQSGARLWGR